MEIVLPKNHIIYSSAQHINEICKPLKKTFGITTFSYVKINPDYSRVHLENYPQWTNFFYKKLHNYHKNSTVTECQHWNSGYAPLQLLAEKQCIKDAQEFNIGNGIVIADHFNGCTELTYFALPTNSSDAKFISLLNNIDTLKKFINYFKDQATDILNNAAKAPIILPFLKPNQTIKNFSEAEIIKNEFLNLIQTDSSKNLSKRSQECINYIRRGYSAKMIARELNISHRTVEHHLAHIREKLKITSTKQLLTTSIAGIA